MRSISDVPPGGSMLAARRWRVAVQTKVPQSSKVLFWYGVWRYTDTRQAMDVIGERLVLSAPFRFVCGDARVIRYTGADIDTGGAKEVQMAEHRLAVQALLPGGSLEMSNCSYAVSYTHLKEKMQALSLIHILLFYFLSSPFLFVCGDDRVIRYTGADIDTGGAKEVQMAEDRLAGHESPPDDTYILCWFWVPEEDRLVAHPWPPGDTWLYTQFSGFL
ncbi:hypothetical protein DEO72_LG4g571 [Vigna unguiculata]|uniref:Uncharacterized protein n=1 Tax=Vigna unguiculata TaxID=3917 RepID=A0A4D6LMP9_VIGUN|nr:hypothetical protein DEO72_LG4g571 [Vigna unguiculata]